MLAVGDVDGESSGNSCQLPSAGIWHHGYDEVRNATIHGSRVLEYESAGAAVQCPAHFLNRHVSGRAFHVSHAREHLALAGTFQITVERFVDCHPTERGITALVIRL